MNANDYLTKEEIKQLTEKSNWKAAFEFLDTWSWVAFAFAIVAIWPNVFTVSLSLIILGGKQLACAIIMHDTSHHAQFKSRRANEILGNVFGAYPMFVNLTDYRPYHLKHHTRTGQDDYPDLDLTTGYPAGKMSVARKLFRDLIGLTWIKLFAGTLFINAGLLQFNGGGGGKVNWTPKAERKGFGHVLIFARNMAGPILAHCVMFGILWLTGNPWLYSLWIGAYLTTYQACLRIRSMAEHSVVPNRFDNQLNTRITSRSLTWPLE
ncbi:MAG: fatty acid desaturase [Flavobacteriales bacterium]|jgi:fatty acid desaturase